MSFNTSYSDTGLFGTYVVTENTKHLDLVSHALQQEWHRLCTSVSDAEVFRAKNQLKGKISRTLANKCALCVRYDALGEDVDGNMGLKNKAYMEGRAKLLESGGKVIKAGGNKAAAGGFNKW